MNTLEHLDEIAREAFAGDFSRTGVLSKGELLYVALASGRMRELAPNDSIAYAVDRIGQEWMNHMLSVWRSDSQPDERALTQLEAKAARYDWIRSHPKFLELVTELTGLVTRDLAEADSEFDAAIRAIGTLPSVAR